MLSPVFSSSLKAAAKPSDSASTADRSAVAHANPEAGPSTSGPGQPEVACASEPGTSSGSGANSTPASAGDEASGDLTLETIRAAQDAVISTDWTQNAVRGIAQVLLAQLAQEGFEVSDEPLRTYVRTSVDMAQVAVLQDLVEPNTGVRMQVRTALDAHITAGGDPLWPASALRLTLAWHIYRPQDTIRDSLLVASPWEDAGFKIETLSWALKLPQQATGEGAERQQCALEQLFTGQLRGLDMLTHPEKFELAARDVARELADKLSP